MALSKNKTNFIRSLSRKKVRDAENVFLAEGDKIVAEAIATQQPIELLCATPVFLKDLNIKSGMVRDIIEVTREELRKVSLLQTPQNALAVIKTAYNRHLLQQEGEDDIALALDGIQDPGNMGTIIRIADWFGIRRLLCSNDTVDCYNPKVIQATMGSIFRVNIRYTNLESVTIKYSAEELPVYGTFTDGSDIFTHPLSHNGLLVLGNEGNGISKGVEKYVTTRLRIPSYDDGAGRVDSLNVAVAAAICCAEFRRRQSCE